MYYVMYECIYKCTGTGTGTSVFNDVVKDEKMELVAFCFHTQNTGTAPVNVIDS